MKPLSLKTRIVALVLLVLIVGVWGFATRATALLQADIEALVSTQLSTQIGYMAKELDAELSLRIQVLEAIANRIVLARDAEPAKIQAVLDQRTFPSAIFHLGLVVLNRNGEVVAQRALEPTVYVGRPWAHRGFLFEVMKEDKPLVGPALRIERFAEQPIISIAVPLHDSEGAVTGALFAPVLSSDPDLFGKLNTFRPGKSGRYLVFSTKDNMIIAATDTNRIMEPLPPKGANPLLDRRLYEGFTGLDITRTSRDVDVLGMSRKLEVPNWTLVGGISTDEVFAPVRQIKKRIYLTAALISLVLGFVLILFLKREMHPLETASREMQLMAEGKKTFAPLPVSRRDEIGRLIGSFNYLVRERTRAEEEIQRLNDSLESRVSERTEALLASNQRLETEIQERSNAEESAAHFAKRLQLGTRRMVAVLEEERQRLARELHDRVSSNLTAIRLNLEIMDKQLSAHDLTGLSDRLSDCLGLTADAAITSREISSDLRPSVLDYMGLLPALKDLAERFGRRTRLSVVATGADPSIRLPAEQEIALYRIAQEALLNCAKHARAEHVVIRLDRDSDRVRLSIRDDGAGFEAAASNNDGAPPGLGLLSMRERAEAIGAVFGIESAPESGTQVVVEMPV